MKRVISGMPLIAVVVIAVLICLIIPGKACLADVATIDSDVYVRDMDGDVVGSLAKGDTVIVTGHSGKWNICELGGVEYKVWSEYMTLEYGVSCDEVEVRTKPRKSKSGGKADTAGGVKNKKERSIKGSAFDGKYFW